VHLVPEPNNPADPNAIAIFSCRHVQIGYLTAERCPYVARLMSREPKLKAVFQAAANYGAIIRINLDGKTPEIPDPFSAPEEEHWTDEYFNQDDHEVE